MMITVDTMILGFLKLKLPSPRLWIVDRDRQISGTSRAAAMAETEGDAPLEPLTPEVVEYEPVTGMPPEFCEYLSKEDFLRALPWLAENRSLGGSPRPLLLRTAACTSAHAVAEAEVSFARSPAPVSNSSRSNLAHLPSLAPPENDRVAAGQLQEVQGLR